MSWQQNIPLILLVIVLAGLAGVGYSISQMIGNKDNLADVQKQMTIIAATTSAIIVMTGIFTYLWLRTNPGALVPLVIFMLFLNLELSIISLSASVIQQVS
jgi:hypothetical protein